MAVSALRLLAQVIIAMARGTAAWLIKATPPAIRTLRRRLRNWRLERLQRQFDIEVLDALGRMSDAELRAATHLVFACWGRGEPASAEIIDAEDKARPMSDEALAAAVDQFRTGEKAAGRTPGAGKVWSVFATACDVSEEKYLKYIVARLATYLQIPGYGDMLVKVNGWDPETLASFRSHDAVKSVGGLIDSVATTSQLAEIAKIIPEHWRPAAVGDAKECARRWVDQFEAGADGIIIHASTPDEFEPVLAEYARIRPHHRFEGRTNRPGA
jgi:alkanesulfonate monooxygenase SsuD/methylene tetrahydromethanopterin reductase-like flavin-dependent oxidoreductase (luciferase family)